MQRRILGAVLALLLPLAASAADKSPTLAEAQRAYHFGQYRVSLAMFEQLAGRRNAEAAECAGFMLLMGEGLYGTQVHRDVERAKVLLVEAAAAGRPGAGFLLNMIERTD
jgi:hypothetical protein